MGNVLDCSSDPLEQIHEPDSSRPTEVGPTGSDDARSQGSSHHQPSRAGMRGDRQDMDGRGERISPQPLRPEVSYLEKSVPLRDSIMWKLQREYYMAHHVKCWEKMVVPCFVTSNSFIARAYARVLVGFMRDWFLFSGRADRSEPLIILEIGAGHGKFSCLVLQHLLEMREFLPTLTPKSESETSPSPEEGCDGVSPEASEQRQQQGGEGEGAESRTSRDNRAEDSVLPPTTPTTKGTGAGPNDVDGAAAAPAADDGDDSSETGGGGEDSGSADATATPGRDSTDNGEPSRRRQWSEAAEGLPFRYVVTDVAQGTLDYVRCHPSMQAFLSKGILELAVLDAEDPNPPSELLLQVSGETVDLKAAKNPVASVCNYVLDSLVQDAFRVKGNTLYENRVTITATMPLPEDLSKLSLTALQGLGLRWEHRPHAVPADRAGAYYYYAGVSSDAASRDVEGLTTSPAPGGGETPAAAEATGGGDAESASPATQDSSAGDPNARVDGDGSEEPNHKENEVPSMGEVADQGFASEEGGAEAGKARDVPESGGDDAVTTNGPAIGGTVAHGAADEGHSAPGVGRGVDGKSAGRGTEGASDADFDGLLGSYVHPEGGEDGAGGEGGSAMRKKGASLLMPLGALRLLRHLSSLSGGRGLVLVGDKGYVREEEMEIAGERDPHIAYHGSLSCMVNLDALARYARQKGGWALSSPYMEGFKCQALAFGMGEGCMQETRFAFEDSTQAFGPESFSTLQRAVKDEVSTPSLGLVVQLLRLSRLDPDVFMKFRTSMVEQVSSQDLPPPIWEDLQKDTMGIAGQSYPLQQGKDVDFEAARLLMALKDFEAAVILFRRSANASGEHHVTCHHMGVSYFYLGKIKEAKGCFERSLVLDENHEDSVRWLAHVRRNMVPPFLADAVPEARLSAADVREIAAVAGGGPESEWQQ
ncbi:unnamed protein product [Scytosiphon promiscuus]